MRRVQMNDNINPEDSFIDLLELDLDEFHKQFETIESKSVKDHSQILFSLYEQIDEVDFRNEAGFLNDDQKLLQKHFLVTCVEKILETADKNNWGVCRNHNLPLCVQAQGLILGATGGRVYVP